MDSLKKRKRERKRRGGEKRKMLAGNIAESLKGERRV